MFCRLLSAEMLSASLVSDSKSWATASALSILVGV